MTYLCDLCGQSFSFWCVAVCTELVLADRACLSAHSSDLIIAIITVLYFLYLQGDWSDLLSEGRNTNVGIDGVGSVSAVNLWAISISSMRNMRSMMVGKGHDGQGQQSQNSYLNDTAKRSD